jgi:hypothetical protein
MHALAVPLPFANHPIATHPKSEFLLDRLFESLCLTAILSRAAHRRSRMTPLWEGDFEQIPFRHSMRQEYLHTCVHSTERLAVRVKLCKPQRGLVCQRKRLRCEVTGSSALRLQAPTFHKISYVTRCVFAGTRPLSGVLRRAVGMDPIPRIIMFVYRSPWVSPSVRPLILNWM